MILTNGGEVFFEWPNKCSGWLLPELLHFVDKSVLPLDFTSFHFPKCFKKPAVMALRFGKSFEQRKIRVLSMRGLCTTNHSAINAEISSRYRGCVVNKSNLSTSPGPGQPVVTFPIRLVPISRRFLFYGAA